VDAVGQKAGTLRVGGAAVGNNATLAVPSGWIEVTDALVVGPDSGTGTVQQTGGTVKVLSPAGVTIDKGSYDLAGGHLYTPLLDKSAGATSTFSFSGGTLHAAVVGFDLVNSGGTIAPGNSPGPMLVDGFLHLDAGSLEIELASPSSFDTIEATGPATLGGSLDVLLLAGYAPPAGSQWTILTAAGGITGAFDSITPGFATELAAGGTQLVLKPTGIPEPATLLGPSLAAALLALNRRRGSAVGK
jgi:hypothetical protein